MNKKLIITGTSRDIGAGLAKICKELNIDVIEINRSQFDLTDRANLNKISSLIKSTPNINIIGCINNSYADGYGQLETLFTVCECFGDDPTKTIITLGSVNKARQSFDNINQVKYSIYKAALEDATNRLKILYPNLNIVYETLPMCDTSYNKDKTAAKVSIEDISNKIINLINYNNE
jgi:NAD(P)-dependent dehydrogenase (short-subunit alcohol dehydrogenase family)